MRGEEERPTGEAREARRDSSGSSRPPSRDSSRDPSPKTSNAGRARQPDEFCLSGKTPLEIFPRLTFHEGHPRFQAFHFILKS